MTTPPAGQGCGEGFFVPNSGGFRSVKNEPKTAQVLRVGALINFTLVRNGTCMKCDTCDLEIGTGVPPGRASDRNRAGSTGLTADLRTTGASVAREVRSRNNTRCRASGPDTKNGARPCESIDATPLLASHPTQELISD